MPTDGGGGGGGGGGVGYIRIYAQSFDKGSTTLSPQEVWTVF
jgi:hypothetical protein